VFILIDSRKLKKYVSGVASSRIPSFMKSCQLVKILLGVEDIHEHYNIKFSLFIKSFL